MAPARASDRGMKGLSSVIAVLAALAVFAAPAGASSIGLAKVGKLGDVLVNNKGVTVYLFEKDKGGRSSCYGACAKAWSPVLTSGRPKARDGARSSLLGTTRRRDGKRQITYHGHPLYTYEDDHGKAGTAKGQDVKEFGAEWYVLNRSGNVVHGDA
jgi:predicted lipoprotein with Yx(FWY)xxD motif